MPSVSMINWFTFYKVNFVNSLAPVFNGDSVYCTCELRLPRLFGWYMLEATVESSKQITSLTIEYDYGSGFSKHGSKSLLLHSKKIYKRIIYLNRNIKKIRINTLDSDEIDIIKKFSFVKITSQFAHNRMLKKVGLNKVNKDQNSIAKVWRSYNKYFDNVYSTQYLSNLAPSYKNWISIVERDSLPSNRTVMKIISSWESQPLISVILPTYNTPIKYLKACIDSVISQSYENWELCIADDHSSSSGVIDVIQEYKQKFGSKIKVVLRNENGHISACSNSAIEVASGDYIAFLDHDDMLSKDALYFVAGCINQCPSAKLIYSDEDWIDENDTRLTPHFKSDWNPDLFYSHNYITHLSVFEATLITKVQGLRLGVEGSQDYDLILRCLPYIGAGEIQHIPRILYHWRAIEGSTALDSGEKSYTVAAGKKSLQDHFVSIGLGSVVVESSEIDNTYRIRWPIPKAEPRVTLIIPTKDMKSVTEVAVASILKKTTYSNYHIVIVDNNSTDKDALRYLDELNQKEQRVSVLSYNHPFNYSAINNFAVAQTEGDIIGLINNDVEVINGDWLSEMVSHASRAGIGCVGAKLYYRDETIQHAGIIMGLGGTAAHSHKHFPRDHPGYIGRLKMTQNLSGVTAACLLVRREVYEKVGGLNEKHLKVAYNDVDFCLKVKAAGYNNLWTPFAELYHYESLSRGYEDNPEKKKRFAEETTFLKEKWGDVLKKDPYYNPNLTLDREDFSIRVR